MSIKETTRYNESDDQLIVTTTYDNSDIIEASKQAINAAPEFGRYKTSNSGMVHAGRIHEGDIVRLKNMGYNLLSPDRDEVKRALLYIQTNEPYLLTLPGKPFSKKKVNWE